MRAGFQPEMVQRKKKKHCIFLKNRAECKKVQRIPRGALRTSQFCLVLAT